MNAAVVAVGVIIAYLLGYKFYSRFISEKVFGVSNTELTPAHELNDGVDYVAANKHVLFGHHFASIAGAAPIIGPAIAVFWGWLPALIWVVFGTIFMGAVHDFSALVVSARKKGRSVGDLAGVLISPRARTLFLVIVYFLVFFVIAVFAYAIAVLFVKVPSSVFPVNFQICIALVIGVLFYRLRVSLLWPSLVALALLYGSMYVGTKLPVHIPPVMGSEIVSWVILLMLYSYIASVLPVWVLLQPRDYINSHQLFLGLGILFLGILVAHPTMQAPMLNLKGEGVPLIPFLFVTIACGAISGFHGLVSSGTTSKQLDKMEDARFIGYGGMLGEGSLAMMATLAVAAGIKHSEWLSHYDSWGKAASTGIANFVYGASTFLESLHIPEAFGSTLISVMVISFAATSLDTASRIQRLVIGEIGAAYNLPILKNRYVGAALAVIPALLLAILAQAPGKGPGSGGFLLWPLFGATNQLIGGLTLLVVTVYLWKAGKPFIYTMVPMIFLIVITTLSMLLNFSAFSNNYLLLFLSVITLALALWLILEAIYIFRQGNSKEAADYSTSRVE